MERSRESRCVASSASPGVENPKVVDLIGVDPASDKVVLTMIERRAWGASDAAVPADRREDQPLHGLRAGRLPRRAAPGIRGQGASRSACECAEEPHGEAVRFVAAATQSVQAEGIEFVVAVAAAAGMSAKTAKPTKPVKPAKPRFFATPADFRAWLTANHATAPELLVGFHKVGTGKPSITWPQSVDQALCFGWIDGVRRSLGADALHDPLHAAQPAQHLEHDQHASASPRSKRRARSPPPAAPRSPPARPSARASTASSRTSRPRSPRRNARRSAPTRRRGRSSRRVRPGTSAPRRTGWSAPRSRRRATGAWRTLIADSAAGRTIGPLTRPGGNQAGRERGLLPTAARRKCHRPALCWCDFAMLTETRHSVCPLDCPDACSLEVKVEDGRVVARRRAATSIR